MPPLDVVAAKAACRLRQRELLAQLGPDERRQRSGKLLEHLVALPQWQAARRVLLFAPLPSEPDVDLLWREPGSGQPGALVGKTCVYPRIDGEAMQLLPVGSLAELVPGRWGLREPAVSAAPALTLRQIDLALIPGLAFDRQGGRLGRGGGFFDRLLADRLPATFLVGVAFLFQVVEQVPLTPHDIPMNAVVTD